LGSKSLLVVGGAGLAAIRARYWRLSMVLVYMIFVKMSLVCVSW
jgi:hypothetical protein